jgi:hypothetical protein
VGKKAKVSILRAGKLAELTVIPSLAKGENDE